MREEYVAANEIKTVAEESHYINPFEVAQYAGKMASDVKKNLKPGYDIIKTKITVSYFVDKDI